MRVRSIGISESSQHSHVCVLMSQVLENEYLRSMRANRFSPNVPVYVASGLLTYGADDGERSSLHVLLPIGILLTRLTRPYLKYNASKVQCQPLKFLCIAALRNVTTYLREAGVCSTVHHKEQFIDAETMAGAL